jgi:hypothetical protein
MLVLGAIWGFVASPLTTRKQGACVRNGFLDVFIC